MSFMMMKKKKYKFQVEFEVEELSNVPFVTGMLFTKVRLLDGGSFANCTNRADVVSHIVQWKTCFRFTCKMVSNAISGELEPCMCRVSIRKEMKGGRSYQKLGFTNINLAKFAGSGKVTCRYLLTGYNPKRMREDNSVLKISVHLIMLEGDPCFKVPDSVLDQPISDDALTEDNRVKNHIGDSDTSPSGSGLTGLNLNVYPSDQLEVDDIIGGGSPVSEKEGLKVHGHSRTASSVSTQSKMSGLLVSGNLASHSRQPSTDSSQFKFRTNTCSSADAAQLGSLRRHNKMLDDKDAYEVVDELLKTAGLSNAEDKLDEGPGLQLALGKDGSMIVGLHNIKQ